MGADQSSFTTAAAGFCVRVVAAIRIGVDGLPTSYSWIHWPLTPISPPAMARRSEVTTLPAAVSKE